MYFCPCEIVVKKVLPAIRKEICYYLINKKKMKASEVSKFLGLTRAAVSQYCSKKRGVEIKFDKETREEIYKLADNLINKKNISRTDFVGCFCFVCKCIRKKGLLCKHHKKNNEYCYFCK
ncbi:MAG: transcriptional regulator [Candidatus Diapherotrites archaeon]|nr:transcriptional regulator [Candidatus Diapherotrites archaeon]